MERPSLRRLVGGAMTAVILTGCGGRGPLAEPLTVDDARWADDGARPSRATEPTAARPSRHDLPTLDDGAALGYYLQYAALSNPGLEAKFQDWRAAVERMPQVSALPDPRFTYGYYLGEIETRVGPTQHTLSLSQTFPWFGKLQDREDAAARNAAAAHRRFEAARLELFLRVEQAYNELAFLEKSIDITHNNIELLRQFEQVAQTRYRVATAGHPDLIKIQVEIGAIENRLLQLRDLRAPHVARLNASLGRPATAPVPGPGTVSDRVTDASSDDLFAALLAHSPTLIALDEEIERERIGVAAARKDGLPDLTVGLAHTAIGSRDAPGLAENGDDALLGTVSVNIPLWRDKYDAGVREAIARRLAAAGRRGDAVNTLASSLQEAIFEHADARRRVGLYRDTLTPKAEEALQASLSAFAQGTSDFLDLIDAQRTLLEFQLALERALVDRATSYARIERLVGADLSEIGAAPTSPEDTP